ncbi:MAG: DUF3473 domain-containing protein [Caldithrix sp.]|nr:DUF3473 domain-containing protein [Caldithrix sp.]
MKHILSVDVEEWFHPEAVHHLFPNENWQELDERVTHNVLRLLDLFEKREVTATFFILGWIARQHPELVKRIAEAGHEIASHGNQHRMLTKMNKDEFREDLKTSKDILQDVIGQQVIGFRAPTFSLVKETRWAWSVMVDLGFRYDSSVYPIWHDRYGIPDAPRFAYTAFQKNGQSLIEFPMPTLRILGKNIPFGGGGYLRLLPLPFTKMAIRRFHSLRQPSIIYVHPWEFDDDQPRLNLGAVQKWRHYHNIDKNLARLGRLLQNYQWVSFKDFLDSGQLKP